MTRRVAVLLLTVCTLACGQEFSRGPAAPSSLMLDVPAGSSTLSWHHSRATAPFAVADQHVLGPTGFVFQVSGSTVTLGWIAAPGNVSQYLIEAGSATGLADLAVFLTGSTGTVTTVTSVPTGIYYVRLRAVVDGVLSSASNEIVVSVGGACPSTVSPLTSQVPRDGGTVTIAVTSACQWNATSLSPFIRIVAGASGTGNGAVVILVAANGGGTRTGSVTVAGQLVSITQDAFTLHVGFELYDPATQAGPTTECRINAPASRCVLRSTSFPFGTNAITTYSWTVQYTYANELRTHSQVSASPEFSFTDACGLASSDASGPVQPMLVTLMVTDNVGSTGQAVSGTFNQPALSLRLFTCP